LKAGILAYNFCERKTNTAQQVIMTQILHIHPKQPQLRLIRQAVAILQNDGVIVYPTDSAYALGCKLGSTDALSRIRNLRALDKNHNFTLVCRNLSELAAYAVVNNSVFRLLKAYTPGPYTFILNASREVPRRLQHPKRKTIGLRIPDNAIAQALLSELNEPLMSVTLILPHDELPVCDPTVPEVLAILGNRTDLILDGGACGFEPTTVINCVDEIPLVVRKGKGEYIA
jgi:tRNA threonylcarbamoyl adenosine modification protein (Sua5/YciO/YrdC/YwlC family)